MSAYAPHPTLAVVGPRPDGFYLVDTRLWKDADPETLGNMFAYALAEHVRVDKLGPHRFAVMPLGEPVCHSQLVFPFPEPPTAHDGPVLPKDKVEGLLEWLAHCRAAGTPAPPSLPPSWASSDSDSASTIFEVPRAEPCARPSTPVQQVLTTSAVVADNDGRAPVILRQMRGIDVWRDAAGPATPQAARIQIWRDAVTSAIPRSVRARSVSSSHTAQDEAEVQQYLLQDNGASDAQVHGYSLRSRTVKFNSPAGPSNTSRPKPSSSRKSKPASQAATNIPYAKPPSRKAAAKRSALE
jgi:hypothetical protein